MGVRDQSAVRKGHRTWLTDTAIKQAKPGAKPVKLFDGSRLFLLLTPEGGRRWRLKYRFDGKEKLLALGVYPEVPMKLARTRAEDARRLLAEASTRTTHAEPRRRQGPSGLQTLSKSSRRNGPTNSDRPGRWAITRRSSDGWK